MNDTPHNEFFAYSYPQLLQALQNSNPTSVRWNGISAEIQRRLSSGDATLAAMKSAADHLQRTAPQDHDIIMCEGDLTFDKVTFMEPHTFLFEGFNQNGHRTGIIKHFSQVQMRVIHRPKQTPERIITGFGSA